MLAVKTRKERAQVRNFAHKVHRALERADSATTLTQQALSLEAMTFWLERAQKLGLLDEVVDLLLARYSVKDPELLELAWTTT